MAVLMIFWDGVGYGKEDPSVNPFFVAKLPTLRTLFDGSLPSLHNRKIFSSAASITPVNSTLGVPGLPQSGTGQTAIFTGVNAPKKIGKHFGPHPYSTLVPVIKEKNIFVRLQRRQKNAFFANGFPKRYFDYINSPRGKTPVVALSYLSSGRKLNTVDDIAAGSALSADCTNEGLNTFGYHLPVLSPFEAGKRFYEIGRSYDFTVFEYFFSDKAGHSRSMKTAVDVLERIDGFLGGILHSFDDEHDILLFISDHGNIEDLSTKSHTRNPVPLILVGSQRRFFSERISKLTDVTPAVESFVLR
ncbi:MAG TPA: metalloenzyme [Bacteroidota bacterium]|nr:metalloenzyme [Bacteroidota bacterium]